MAKNKWIVKIKKRIRVHLCSFVAKILSMLYLAIKP